VAYSRKPNQTNRSLVCGGSPKLPCGSPFATFQSATLRFQSWLTTRKWMEQHSEKIVHLPCRRATVQLRRGADGGFSPMTASAVQEPGGAINQEVLPLVVESWRGGSSHASSSLRLCA
jgi:hypothetical protein